MDYCQSVLHWLAIATTIIYADRLRHRYCPAWFMPSSFDSTSYSAANAHTLPQRLTLLSRRCWSQGRNVLCELPQRWHQRPAWARDPLVMIAMIWVGCYLLNGTAAIALTGGAIAAIGVYLAQLDRLHVRWRGFDPIEHNLDPASTSGLDLTLQRSWRHWLRQGWSVLRWHLWQRLWRPLWQRLWTSANRPLTLSLLSGGAFTAMGYGIWLVYQSTKSFALTLVLAIQAGAIATITGYLSYRHYQLRPVAHNRNQSGTMAIAPAPPVDPSSHLASPSLSVVDHGADLTPLLIGLTAPHPPTRLIAIYQTGDWLKTHLDLIAAHSDSSISTTTDADIAKLMTCLRLMLSHETHPSLRQAIQSVLAACPVAPRSPSGV